MDSIRIIYGFLVGGFNPSEKYEFVNWDDELPNIWQNKSHVPNHQPVMDPMNPHDLNGKWDVFLED